VTIWGIEGGENMMEFTFTVNWGDTDAAGIVYYPNYYKWMDNATHHFFNKIGHSSVDLFDKQRVGIPLLETHCGFFSPSFFGNEIVVRSKIEEIRNKVFRIRHTFQRGETKLAEGYQVHAWTDFSKDIPKAFPIPDEIRKALHEHMIE